eukprot:scaffold22681_cov146-Cylindrotheca_fusiformis.AAC.4
MRFKAKLLSDQVSLLYSIIYSIAKLQDNTKGGILYLDPEFVRISCKGENGITCFMELSKDIFLEHRIESAADNVIVCQVDLHSFKLALQSVHGHYSNYYSNNNNNSNNRRHNKSAIQSVLAGQQMVILKLAKRNQQPCLCLDGRQADDSSVEIHQAIPVRILRQTEMQYHLPPQINTPNVQLELPHDRPLKAVVDKLRSMGPHLYLEATMKGDLTVRLDNEGASLACFYSNLVPRWDDEADDEDADNAPDPDATCILKVDAHKLSTCLQWQQSPLPVSSCLMGMVYNEMLILHILLHPDQVGFFTYYIPVYFIHDEDL